ncbi:MAG TPA: hypothetical protein VFB82_19360 [Blastocatellia bacterium]|nr:hypothetical protein [Blastocatellia bacterium]
MMEDDAAPATSRGYTQIEFYAFCVLSFAGKSMLLIRLPYREWPVNTVYTCSLLLFFYLYFRFRQNLAAPPFVVFSLAAAVAVDILGNKLGLYGKPFGPLRDYDEFAHFAGSGFSAIAAYWLLRAGLKRMGFALSGRLLAFLSTTIAFTYCGWYEILELWDELFYGDFERIHSWDDTANDLFYDFLGVIVFIAVTALFFALKSRLAAKGNDLVCVRLRNIFSTLPTDLLAVFFTTTVFGLCSWFEIFRMFDQRWSGRVHLVGFRDSAIRLQWELAVCVTLSLVFVAVSTISRLRNARAS